MSENKPAGEIAYLYRRIFELEGQALAAQTALRALIKHDPDPEAAALAVQTEIETLIAHSLASRLEEPHREALEKGIEKAKKTILPSARAQRRFPR